MIIVDHIGYVKPLSTVSTTAFMDDIEWEIMRQIEEAEEAEDEDTRLQQVAAVGLLMYAGAEESRRLRAE